MESSNDVSNLILDYDVPEKKMELNLSFSFQYLNDDEDVKKIFRIIHNGFQPENEAIYETFKIKTEFNRLIFDIGTTLNDYLYPDAVFRFPDLLEHLKLLQAMTRSLDEYLHLYHMNVTESSGIGRFGTPPKKSTPERRMLVPVENVVKTSMPSNPQTSTPQAGASIVMKPSFPGSLGSINASNKSHASQYFSAEERATPSPSSQRPLPHQRAFTAVENLGAVVNNLSAQVANQSAAREVTPPSILVTPPTLGPIGQARKSIPSASFDPSRSTSVRKELSFQSSPEVSRNQ